MERGKYNRSIRTVVRRHAVALAALAMLAAPAPTRAQSAGVLNGFGLFGTWAVRCGAPAAPDNVVQTVTWTGREPVEYSETNRQGAVGNRYRVLSAQLQGADLFMQVELNGRLVENLTIAKSGTTSIRTMSTQTHDGFLVQSGVVTATGRPTPWLRKCR